MSFERPNVLFIWTDQQRWDTIRAGGNELIHTPNLDALAESGALFDYCYANCPVCMPSRQSVLSGLYPSTVGCTSNGIEMDERTPVLPHYLRPYGYHTANLGKLHFLNHAHRDHRKPHPSYGFDTLIVSDEPGCYDDAYIQWVAMQDPSAVDACRCATPPARKTDLIEKQPRGTHEPYLFEGPEHLSHTAFVADQTIETIRRRAGEPWLAIAGIYAPHCPINPPSRFAEMYDPADMPPPVRNEGENFDDVSEAQWRLVKAYYYGLISHVDDQVGRILAALDATGQRDNTLVIFTSDHGEYLGDHGKIGKGMPGHDASARVPLIMSWPGVIERGGRYSELVELVDLAPTMLEFCGIQTPPALQGRSLRPLLTGGDYESRTSAFMEQREYPAASQKAVATHRFKYCVNHEARELLFDREADPDELTNVADDPAYRDDLEAMRAEFLRRWFEVEHPPRERVGAY